MINCGVLSAGGPVTDNCDTEAPGPPMNPTLAASSATFTSFCWMRPSCQKLVLEINLAPKRGNKLALVLLLLHPNYIKARTPMHPGRHTARCWSDTLDSPCRRASARSCLWHAPREAPCHWHDTRDATRRRASVRNNPGLKSLPHSSGPLSD